ncbi:MAG: LysR family transcriptional regulator [Vitreoscilla sp.]
MDRALLLHLPVVLAVHRRGGFAAAANELDMSPSAVSHAVQLVEAGLGQPLFARTTRSVRLTEAGAAFVASVGPALAEIEEAADRIGADQGRVTGTLKLNAPRTALPIAVTPLLVEMARRHPELIVEVTSDDGLADIVAQGFDAGIRLGHTVAQDMVATRLTPPFRSVMVASPAYLAARGTPARLRDLDGHNCIGYRFVTSGAIYDWDLRDGTRHVAKSVSGSVRVTDAVHAKELALAGVGIAYLFEPLAHAELREGTLRQVLPRNAFEEPGLFLYFPRRASQAPKLRAFIEVARELLNGRPAPASPPSP